MTPRGGADDGIRPFDSSALRVLDAFERTPVPLPERTRLIHALERATSPEWERVLVGLTDDQFAGLPQSDIFYTPNEAHHVRRVASELAKAYKHSHISAGHLAVALSLTCPWHAGGEGTTEIVAEAYGFGTLENFEAVTNSYLGELEREDGGYSHGLRVDGVEGGIKNPEFALRRAAVVTQLVSRLSGTAVLIVLAAAAAGQWPAWLIAVASILSTRDSRDRDGFLADPVAFAELRARWSWHGILAVVAGALSYWDQAAVLVLTLFIAEGISVVGELIAASGMRFGGDAVRRGGNFFRRLPRLGMQYLARLRQRRYSWSVVAGLPTGFVVFLAAPFWPLSLLLTYAVARRRWLLAVATTTVLLLAGHATLKALGLALLPGLLGLIVILLEERKPGAPIPFHPFTWAGTLRAQRRFIRAYRLLRNDQPTAAADTLAGHADAPAMAALRAWALRSAGELGSAVAVARTLPARWMTARWLIEMDVAIQLRDLDGAQRCFDEWVEAAKHSARAARQRPLMGVVLGQLEAARGSGLPVALALSTFFPARLDSDNYVQVMALCRVVSDLVRTENPELAATVAFVGTHLGQIMMPPDETLQRWTVYNRAVLHEYQSLMLAMYRADRLFAPVRTEDAEEQLGLEKGLAGRFLYAGHPLEAADVVLDLATDLRDRPFMRGRAYRLQLEALAILNSMRHRLGDREARSVWWERFAPVLEDAMREAAHGKDWRTLAELIETARLQSGSDVGGESAVIQDAAHIRVRGTSVLEDTSWYTDGSPGAVYELETMAEAAGGVETWWWSTWRASDELFWSLVPPNGQVTGGLFQTAGEVADALSDLRDALPIRYDGESPEQYDDRFRFKSPLWIQTTERTSRADQRRDEELELARRLGSLVPRALADALATADEPLNIAIAPDPSLASFPWAAIALPITGSPRLIERARLTIAPPSALLADISTRSRSNVELLPIELIVADPTGELPAAAALRGALSDRARVLPVRGRALGAEEFASALADMSQHSTLVFAGHTGEVDGAVGLDLGSEVGVLSPSQLLARRTEFPIPRQVVILACDSADLGATSKGEWFTLGPAMLWAGAERAMLTSFPIPDVSGLDRTIVSRLDETHDIRDLLRDAQLQMLDDWKRGDREAAPVHWAGHITMGAFGAADAREQPAPPLRHRAHEAVIKMLDGAAHYAAARGGDRIEETDMALELESYGFEEDLAPWLRQRVIRLSIIARGLTILRRFNESDGIVIDDMSDEVKRLLRRSSEVARRAREQILDTEHVFISYFSGTSRAAARARRLFRWDPREPERARAFLAQRNSGWQHVGRPETPHLSDRLVVEIYKQLQSPVPATDEPRFLGR